MKGEAIAIAPDQRRVTDFLALTKPRLNSLVVVTAGVGYVLGAPAPLDLVTTLHVMLGSGLVAGAAAALNQIAERDLDEAMHRTRGRPLPRGRVTPREGLAFAVALGVVGLVELATGANVNAAAVALATLAIYIGIYTPLKRRTPWATVVGAVPGALPVVIGVAAARGGLTIESGVLFGIVFLWQLPHFHALSWLHRDDFRRAGLPLVATLDTDGRRTARHAVAFAAALLPMSLAPSFIGMAGWRHLALASFLGAAFVGLAIGFLLNPSSRRARTLFRGSLAYLPLLWASLIAERFM